jgi:NAD(P)-dependent dehydrogenase (short-subunit alcohol dehydrogenase family)
VGLITGASRGIGRGIALELAKLGYDLVINFAGNEVAARQTSADCASAARQAGPPIRAEICQADISASGDRRKLIDFTRSTFGRLDLLVNNAGVAPNVRADILEADEESFDRLIAINVKGPYFLTQLAANWMIEQVRSVQSAEIEPAALNVQHSALNVQRSNESNPAPHVVAFRPKIVTISSVSAYAASTNRSDYCVSKAALSMITPLFAARLAEHGINVYEIRPGIIATDMTGPVKDKYDKLIAGIDPIPRWEPRRHRPRRRRHRAGPVAVQHRRSDQRGRWLSSEKIVAADARRLWLAESGMNRPMNRLSGHGQPRPREPVSRNSRTRLSALLSPSASQSRCAMLESWRLSKTLSACGRPGGSDAGSSTNLGTSTVIVPARFSAPGDGRAPAESCSGCSIANGDVLLASAAP